MKETRDVYILDRNTGRKALDICLDSCVYRKEGGGRGDLFCFQSGNMQVECICNCMMLIVFFIANS